MNRLAVFLGAIADRGAEKGDMSSEAMAFRIGCGATSLGDDEARMGDCEPGEIVMSLKTVWVTTCTGLRRE